MRSSERRRKNSLRLTNWDYSRSGYYFITICTQDKANLLGTISQGRMRLSAKGYIVRRCWRDLARHYRCQLDAFIIMPDHIHGIIILKDQVRAIHESPPRESSEPLPPRESWQLSRRRMLICKIIGRFKMRSSKAIHIMDRSSQPLWQRGYYDHIIRTEQALGNIRNYIRRNPQATATRK